MPTRQDESSRQRELDTYRVVDTLPELAFDDITRLASILCGTPIALVSLIDRDRQWFKSRTGLDLTEGKREEAFCDHVIREPGQLMEVADAERDPRFVDNPFVTGQAGIRFYAGMPLVTPSGAAIGTVCVLDREPRQLSAEQRDGMASLARLTMNLLEARHRERKLELATILMAASAPETPVAMQGTESLSPAAPTPVAPAPDTSAFTVAIFELQGLEAAVKRIGDRAVNRALAQLHDAIEAHLRPGSGDTVSHASGSPEMIVVLHGKDAHEHLQPLSDYLRGFDGETSFRVLTGASQSNDAKERPELVYLRADAQLSAAKDQYRGEIAARLGATLPA